jgi:hypothetical protein
MLGAPSPSAMNIHQPRSASVTEPAWDGCAEEELGAPSRRAERSSSGPRKGLDRFLGFASQEETFPVIASAAKQSRAQKKELDRFVGFASSR